MGGGVRETERQGEREGGERERQRQRDRDRETDRQRDRQRDKETDRQTDREESEFRESHAGTYMTVSSVRGTTLLEAPSSLLLRRPDPEEPTVELIQHAKAACTRRADSPDISLSAR